MKNYFLLPLLFTANVSAQSLKLIVSGVKTSFRGLSVVNEKIIWASGDKGTIARSVDSGNTWKWLTVKGFEQTGFRDIEAFDSSTAIIMGIAEPAYILKTIDGGETWKVVYENATAGMFLDAMDFCDKQHGTVIGDPIDSKFFIATTNDSGDTWIESHKKLPVAASGEACFASSGTNIGMLSGDKVYFVSGGLRSRFFMNSKSFPLPVLQGKETTGANSVASKNKETFIVVGGDFKNPDLTLKNCLVTFNQGKTWTRPKILPHGYRSCVEYINSNKWITCGLNGVDYSADNGKTWQWISKESFNVCRKAKSGRVAFLAGNGSIGKLSVP